MPTKQLKISMIMPIFNGKKYLVRSIDSFLNQQYENKELIIVDGKSSDGTHQIIKQYADKYPSIKWINYSDKGLADATNIGVQNASGDIIGYMGCDDLLFENIFRTINQWKQYLNFDAIYFDSYSYYINSKRCAQQKPKHEMTRQNLLKYGTIVGLQNIFFDRRIFDKYEYNISYNMAFDYEFYLAITADSLLFLYVDTIATINFFDNNISSDPRQFHESVSNS